MYEESIEIVYLQSSLKQLKLLTCNCIPFSNNMLDILMEFLVSKHISMFLTFHIQYATKIVQKYN